MIARKILRTTAETVHKTDTQMGPWGWSWQVPWRSKLKPEGARLCGSDASQSLLMGDTHVCEVCDASTPRTQKYQHGRVVSPPSQAWPDHFRQETGLKSRLFLMVLWFVKTLGCFQYYLIHVTEKLHKQRDIVNRNPECAFPRIEGVLLVSDCRSNMPGGLFRSHQWPPRIGPFLWRAPGFRVRSI